MHRLQDARRNQGKADPRLGAYTGRFAPSPTGPLHFGSLVTALASFLDARHAGGRWLLRIEDLDPPRESASAPATIIRQLQACGLEHDGEVLYQSGRIHAYEAALEQLTLAGLTYPYTCSRASIARTSAGRTYSGKCRGKRFDEQHEPYAVRIRVERTVVDFTDRLLGARHVDLASEVGDFIIKRRDGYFAYQLAVVVDDAWQGVTHVVRGNDLLDSTPRQIYLARQLGFKPIDYCHLPVIVNAHGDKLSKQTHAKPIDTSSPVALIRQALHALGQPTHPGIHRPADLLTNAIDAWDTTSIPRAANIRLSDLNRQNA